MAKEVGGRGDNYLKVKEVDGRGGRASSNVVQDAVGRIGELGGLVIFIAPVPPGAMSARAGASTGSAALGELGQKAEDRDSADARHLRGLLEEQAKVIAALRETVAELARSRRPEQTAP